MCRLKDFPPLYILRILYNSFILLHLQYGILTVFFLGRIQTFQKRSVRIITRSKYNTHIDPLFISPNLLKLKDLFELSIFRIYFKFKNNSLPVHTVNMNMESIRNHHCDPQSEVCKPQYMCCIWWNMFALLSSWFYFSIIPVKESSIK